MNRLSCLILCFFIILGCRTSTQKIICIGDSLTSGFQVGEETYPAFLAKEIHKQVENCGELGDRSNTLLNRLPEILEKQPTHVLLEIGANDYFLHIDHEIFQRNLDTIIKTLVEKRIKIALIKFFNLEILNSSKIEDRKILSEYELVLNACASKYQIPIVEDIWGHTFFLPQYKTDAFHPNGRGNQKIANAILKSLGYSFFD